MLIDDKRCYFCGTDYNLHLHHIFHGTADRRISDENGFTVYVCAFHHNLGGNGKCVHQCREMNLKLKQACQQKYEEEHSREEWMALMRKNYLD